MFSPKYLIRLKKKSFAQAEVVCLGTQLLEILEIIEKIIPPHVWYGANVDTNYYDNDVYDISKFQTFFLNKIGTFAQMKKFSEKTDQFISGVFIAIKINEEIAENTVKIDTEDSEFRTIDIDGVIIEIRAFDTAYFEIYTEDYKIIKVLSNQYQVEILNKEREESEAKKARSQANE